MYISIAKLKEKLPNAEFDMRFKPNRLNYGTSKLKTYILIAKLKSKTSKLSSFTQLKTKFLYVYGTLWVKTYILKARFEEKLPKCRV